MERLWAPWRLQYVAKEKTDGCIFCEKPKSGDDRAVYIVYRGALSYVILNAFPYNNGHVMVAPYEHIADLEALPPDTIHDMMDVAQLATRALKSCCSPDGLNLGFNLGAAAGAGIKDHLHLHLVPRWVGDSNFMPVIGDTRVIPESLKQTYDKLREAFGTITEGGAS
jgi:ATP adenylyltransferase